MTEIKFNVLIAEDEENIGNFISAILKTNGYKPIIATTGNQAIQCAESYCPDVILLDLGLPDMDGIDVISEIRKWAVTPIIVISARNRESEKVKALDAGADDYITKPFNAKNLELLVQNIQKSRKQSIEHFKQAEELNIKQITNNPRDEIFMKELMELIMANLTKEDFGVTEITAHLRISRSLLHMKLKSLTGCSITQFIRTIKMKEAKTHLLNGMNVSEASFAVGISDPNYFTKCFKKEFNITPTEFLKQLK